MVYECWKPDFKFNQSEIPSEIKCQDHFILEQDTEVIQYNLAASDEVQWIATAYNDTKNVLGSGTVSPGQEYSISSNDPSKPLPTFVNLTFFVYDGDNQDKKIVLQSTTFPSEFCSGYPDPWYRHGYSHTQILEVQDSMTGKTISTRGSLQDSLWIKVTVDASQSPVPVRLEEMNLVTNMNVNNFNLTGDIYGVVLNGSNTSLSTPTTIMSRTGLRGRKKIHSFIHTRNEMRPMTKELMVGPMALDLYWKTRYTFFTTIIATRLDNAGISCNGFVVHEHIAGLA